MRELILGAKYFIRVNDNVIDVQLQDVLDEYEYIFKNLQDNKPIYLERKDFQIVTEISSEEDSRLNNQDIFSVKSDLLEAVISRDEMRKHLDSLDKNSVLISITDPDRELLHKDIIDAFKDSLQISFWDVEECIGRFCPISESQAKSIKDFILDYKGSKFVIHCEAGLSRSAGVAMAVECLVNYDGIKYNYATGYSDVSKHCRYSPNLTVYDKILAI